MRFRLTYCRPLVSLVAIFVLLLDLTLGQSLSNGSEQKPRVQTFRGQIVAVAAVLHKSGVALDPDAAELALALKTEDGKLYPLIKDVGSRMFFTDRSLLNRPMQIRGRLVPPLGWLQVLEVHSIKSGRLYELYYWCDVCAIKRFYLDKTGICECCGGPMKLREVLVEEKPSSRSSSRPGR